MVPTVSSLLSPVCSSRLFQPQGGFSSVFQPWRPIPLSFQLYCISSSCLILQTSIVFFVIKNYLIFHNKYRKTTFHMKTKWTPRQFFLPSLLAPTGLMLKNYHPAHARLRPLVFISYKSITDIDILCSMKV